MWAKLLDVWGYMHWWEQQLILLCGAWLVIELVRDMYPDIVSKFWSVVARFRRQS
jgi:hypothetical protein